MIGVVVISAEDVLVYLGGWDKEPTGGVRVYFSRCFLAGEVKIRGSLFYWRRGDFIAEGGWTRL